MRFAKEFVDGMSRIDITCEKPKEEKGALSLLRGTPNQFRAGMLETEVLHEASGVSAATGLDVGRLTLDAGRVAVGERRGGADDNGEDSGGGENELLHGYSPFFDRTDHSVRRDKWRKTEGSGNAC
jgi:hypothetical protein